MATETTEDFEAEYSEALAREVSGPGQEGHEEDLQLEPLALETHSDADRRLRSIRYWQGELEKIRETAAVEYERVEAWVEKHEQRINKRLKWNEDALRPYLWSTGKKSVDLPSGQIRRRVGRERVEVVLEETAVDWAEKNRLPELVRVRKTIDKRAALQWIKDTGEEPPGLELTRSEDSFTVDVR